MYPTVSDTESVPESTRSTLSSSPDHEDENLPMPAGIAVSFYSQDSSYQEANWLVSETSFGRNSTAQTTRGDYTPYGDTPYGPSRNPSATEFDLSLE